MDIGLYLKKRYGVKLLFDMRGFWVDERVDGGLWNMKNPFYQIAFKTYKKKEAEYIKNADHIVSLTNVAKGEIQKWSSYNKQGISVIPCSVDFSVFSLNDQYDKLVAKKKLDYSSSDFVVGYLGSLGTWYLFDEMLLFFKELKKVYANAKFLFITPDKPEVILAAAKEKGLDTSDFSIFYARKRAEVAEKIKASDISLVFIKKCYSKMASSPTKLGELLALGVPVICNEGVGDVNEIITNAKGGLLLQGFSEKDFKEVIAQIPSVLKLKPEEIRSSNEGYYNLTKSIAEYSSIYNKVMSIKDTHIPSVVV
ncbi:MAG: glycosyltransferase [Flavisolibacter sp.]|nr:glycosyltransferase [Flavisolibacter sp.]